MLYIFGGLPATGKSTLSRQLAQRLNALYLRIDTIEQAIRSAGGVLTGPEGYAIAQRVAVDNLRLGNSVIADSVNPIRITRDAWQSAAREADAPYLEIEIVCSDKAEHRLRAESRPVEIAGLEWPKWREIEEREYEPWDRRHIVIDTAGRSIDTCYAELLAVIESTAPGV
jgi:predicted kinase